MLTQSPPKLIGTVAKESGIPIKTIRYYEELGLLKAVGRTEGGYRLFGDEVGDRLHFIKRAQSLGLSLAEIREFLMIHDQGELPCDQVKACLKDKLEDIDQQIKDLQLLKHQLQQLLSKKSNLLNGMDATICPIIEQDSAIN
ncbi:MAG: heavy metal-responsive transcriptional regulator [Kaiparowitsia implicata GSE-PSE-MK54-09C]|jgi:DNA-binding transcriptional MerR regulator|nr:heavy metal-responsive transcriptional regulator [Kaiparowitsia implicata GSE-PSE-MK54-09C]